MNDIDSRLARDAALWQERIDTASTGRPPRQRSRRALLTPLLSAAAVGILAAGAAGLIAHQTASQAGPSSAGPAATNSGPTGSPRADDLRPQVVQAPLPQQPSPARLITGDPLRMVSMPWRLAALPDGGGSVDLLAMVGDGTCTVPVGVQVAETSDTVQVWIWSRQRAGRGDCAAQGQLQRLLVPLKQPLGSRTLLHAPVSSGWANAIP
jgi:hypothetical protein